MERIKKMTDWLLSHLVLFQGVLIVLVIIVSILSSINKWNSDIVIISLLIFIGSEFFVMSVGYLERIQRRLDGLGAGPRVVKRIQTTLLSEIIRKSQKELFISGVHMASLVGVRDEITNAAKRGVKVQILAFNLDNAIITGAYVTMREADAPDLNFTYLKSFLGKKNIELRIIDAFMPVLFVAGDMNSSNGHIKATHLFYKTSGADLPTVEMNFGDGLLYHDYLNQIRMLWNDGKQWDSTKKGS